MSPARCVLHHNHSRAASVVCYLSSSPDPLPPLHCSVLATPAASTRSPNRPLQPLAARSLLSPTGCHPSPQHCIAASPVCIDHILVSHVLLLIASWLRPRLSSSRRHGAAQAHVTRTAVRPARSTQRLSSSSSSRTCAPPFTRTPPRHPAAPLQPTPALHTLHRPLPVPFP